MKETCETCLHKDVCMHKLTYKKEALFQAEEELNEKTKLLDKA